jgi:hypothetical protein
MFFFLGHFQEALKKKSEQQFTDRWWCTVKRHRGCVMSILFFFWLVVETEYRLYDGCSLDFFDGIVCETCTCYLALALHYAHKAVIEFARKD